MGLSRRYICNSNQRLRNKGACTRETRAHANVFARQVAYSKIIYINTYFVYKYIYSINKYRWRVSIHHATKPNHFAKYSLQKIEKRHFFYKIFGQIKKIYYLCTKIKKYC